ncbi:hypothetical protein E2C01_025680 [Portunus trituberculatus]|uniref:Uncharacterized protein n=1 Tax=Portunus trituberculatus TaxID=210409 RepID=A0A5B7EDK9_PORTR|nr:hypothetical protein [Portunus trituberculatus]
MPGRVNCLHSSHTASLSARMVLVSSECVILEGEKVDHPGLQVEPQRASSSPAPALMEEDLLTWMMVTEGA